MTRVRCSFSKVIEWYMTEESYAEAYYLANEQTYITIQHPYLNSGFCVLRPSLYIYKQV